MSIRVLLVEDSPDDAALLIRQLRLGGFEPVCERVDTAGSMSAALDARHWDIIIADYTLPRFSGLAALALTHQRGLDLPFIIVSGTISEEVAVEAMKAGAHDYVLKGNLTRLAPAVEREMREAEARAGQRHAKKLEEERNCLQTALAAQEKALGVVSHELRTPLAAARAMAEFLLTDGADPLESRHFVQAIHDEVVRMSTMVNDLLEVSRLNSGAAKWNWGVVPVAEACDAALDSVRPLLRGKAVDLLLDVQPTDLTVSGDAEAVRRLVLNLVGNAVKFTDEGSVHLRATRVTAAGGDFVEIRVTDTGSGMTRETAAKLGEAFALNTGMLGDGHATGSGLGLSICKAIVAAHGGTIAVASEVGRGTTITVLLRADLAEPLAEELAAPVFQRAA